MDPSIRTVVAAEERKPVVRLRNEVLQNVAGARKIAQVADTQSPPPNLVFVGRPDPTARRADPLAGRPIELFVERQHEVRAVGELESPAEIEPPLRELIQLRQERLHEIARYRKDKGLILHEAIITSPFAGEIRTIQNRPDLTAAKYFIYYISH